MRFSAVQITAMIVAGVLGVGTAWAVAGGGRSAGVRACALKATGEIRATTPSGRCAASEVTITISGDAFKKSRNQTLTINGVAFRRGGTRVITINGTAFRTGTLPNTLTINGNTFRTGTLPNTLTINGNTFRTGTLPNSLTINGVGFESGRDGLLTIAGQAVPAPTVPGPAGPAGATGATGQPGPTGPPGVASGARPSEQQAPIPLTVPDSGPPASATVRSVSFTNTDGVPHRIQLSGGFNLACDPCAGTAAEAGRVAFGLTDGGSDLVSRSLSRLSSATSPDGGASFAEVVDTPEVCGPCTFSLRVSAGTAPRVPDPGGGAQLNQKLDISSGRLALVDLGPVTP